MSGNRFTPSKLVSAIRAGRLSGVVAALEDGGDIEEADIHGFRGLPLRTACFEGEMAIIRELLRCGADVNAPAADGPGAPLRLALRRGHREVAALLLQSGADVPPGLEIDPAILNAVGTQLPIESEINVPTLPEKPADNLIEFTPREPAPPEDPIPSETTSEPGVVIEEVNVPACFGTDTNLLTMDLMRQEEDARKAPEPAIEPGTQSGFWKRRSVK